MSKRWLDIPTLSQGNTPRRGQQPSIGGDWCGRASASMMFNYYAQVAGEGESKFIVNSRSKKNLVYPSGDIAAPNYNLAEPLERALKGWSTQKLFPTRVRTGYSKDAEGVLDLSDRDIHAIVAPIIESIDINNPVLAYTGISQNAGNPCHIVVFSGYHFRDDGLWLLIEDPATIRDWPGRKTDKPENLGWENVDILEEGAYYQYGARYWLRARRLFEPNQYSSKPGDLWCDYNTIRRGGFCVWINDTPTPDSPYVHGGLFFPLLVKGGDNPLSISSDSVSAYYEATEANAGASYFPVGQGGVWHGGVHLKTSPSAPVAACTSGRLVAARLADEDIATGAYGSRNFVLLQHELATTAGPKRFFSLYMHLAPLDPSSLAFRELDWMEQADKPPMLPVLPRLQQGELLSLDLPVSGGQRLGYVGLGGSEDHRDRFLHWEIFSEENLYAPLLEPAGGDGEAGPAWYAVEDPDENYNVDHETIFALFKDNQEFFGRDSVLTHSELKDFYTQNDNRQALRRYACRFVSEWGIPDLDHALKQMRRLGFGIRTRKERMAPYLWWEDAKAAGVSLPASPHVWHYNPIQFMEALHEGILTSGVPSAPAAEPPAASSEPPSPPEPAPRVNLVAAVTRKRANSFVSIGATVLFEARMRYPDATPEELARVSWRVQTLRGELLLKRERHGPKLTWAVPLELREGGSVVVHAYVNQPSRSVMQIIQVIPALVP